MTRTDNSAEPDGDAPLDAEVPPRESDPRAARRKAMDLLARREYGRAELIGRLAAAGFDADMASEVVAVLTGEGLQDDARFAASFLTAKASRGGGPLRIRQAMKEKGLDSASIDQAFSEDATDWFEQARLVREKKFGTTVPETYADKAKQMRFLSYRGFDYDQIDAAFSSPAD